MFDDILSLRWIRTQTHACWISVAIACFVVTLTTLSNFAFIDAEHRRAPVIIGLVLSTGLGAIIPFAVLQLIIKLNFMTDQMTELANCDSMTKTMTRRYFFERNAAVSQTDTHIIICDLDTFKRINDQHGHAAGDTALVRFAEVLKATVGDEGDVCRVGGDEFLVLLRIADNDTVMTMAERLRCEVSRTQIFADTGTITLSTSVGVTKRTAGHLLDAAIARADQALYHAKNAGRNRVAVEHQHAA